MVFIVVLMRVTHWQYLQFMIEFFETLDEWMRLVMFQTNTFKIDDILPQSNWPEGHDEKVKNLIAYLDFRNDLSITKLKWASGIIIATKL